MKSPKTGGDFFRLLVRRYGTNRIADLVTLSGINYGTIQNWQERPSARIRRGGKTHYRRLFLEKPGNLSEDDQRQ